MKNVEINVKGKVMTITVDLSKDQGASASGKTIIIGTTAGNTRIAANGTEEFFVGLNVYKYPKTK
jgi:uncharacterized OB-fold protein